MFIAAARDKELLLQMLLYSTETRNYLLRTGSQVVHLNSHSPWALRQGTFSHLKISWVGWEVGAILAHGSANI